MNVDERFWSKVSGGPVDECWIWRGGITYKGYGRTRWNSRTRPAHRVAYELLIGEIPEGLVLDHLCRVRSCVNPSHLEPVTAQVNTARGIHAQSLKTHCPAGHPYSPENTYHPKRGDRQCRTCNCARSRTRYRDPARIEKERERSREYQRRKRESALGSKETSNKGEVRNGR